jgi:thymidylate synthase ThyX
MSIPMPSDLPPVHLSANAELVLAKRYLRKNLEGQPTETPQELFWRVASSIAQVETRYPKSPWKAPELAREVLPNSLKTEIVVTANYREWRHIFKLRAIGTPGRPHPQMRALVLPVLEEFKEKLPALFGDLEVKSDA